MFFPYYVLRYEKNLPSVLPKDRERLECLLQEFEDLRERLNKELDEEKLSGYYYSYGYLESLAFVLHVREHGVLPCSPFILSYKANNSPVTFLSTFPDCYNA